MHFQQHEENRAKYVTSDPNIGQTIVWPFMLQVRAGFIFLTHFFSFYLGFICHLPTIPSTY